MVNQTVSRETLARWKKTAWGIGVGAAVLCAIGCVWSREQFFPAYLCSFIYWFGLGIGCLGILLLHHVTSGAWGDLIRPMLEAGALTLPWLAALFLPVILGVATLYPWARPSLVAADAVLQHQRLYLNVPFFVLRAIFYFGLWSWMAFHLNQWSNPDDFAAAELARRRSAPGLLLFVFTITFAMIDWMMSLDPHWYSTMYGALVMIGHLLGSFAFLICALSILGNIRELTEKSSPKPFLDLGNMLLAFVMFWAYMSFSQYLIIWEANMPEEITWYLPRQHGSWFITALILIIFQFIFPFLVLLGRGNKTRLERLAWVGGLILVVHAVEIYWLIQPTFYPQGWQLHWQDLASFAAVGGLWLGAFLHQLIKRPQIIGSYEPEEAA